jgi:hypothetical protein
VLKGTYLQTVEHAKSKTADLLNRVSADDLQHYFEKWKSCMQQCTDGGKYFDGEIKYFLKET